MCAFLAGLVVSTQGAKALCRDSRRSDSIFITAGVWTVLLLLPWRSKTIFLLLITFGIKRDGGLWQLSGIRCGLLLTFIYATVKVPYLFAIFSIADAIFSFR